MDTCRYRLVQTLRYVGTPCFNRNENYKTEWGLETARFMFIADISSGGVTSKSDEICKLATDAVDVLMNSAPKEYSVEGCIKKQFESDVYIEEPDRPQEDVVNFLVDLFKELPFFVMIRQRCMFDIIEGEADEQHCIERMYNEMAGNQVSDEFLKKYGSWIDDLREVYPINNLVRDEDSAHDVLVAAGVVAVVR